MGGTLKKKKHCVHIMDGVAFVGKRDAEWWRGLEERRPFVA